MQNEWALHIESEKWMYTIDLHGQLNTLYVSKLLVTHSRFHYPWCTCLIQLLKWIHLISKPKQEKLECCHGTNKVDLAELQSKRAGFRKKLEWHHMKGSDPKMWDHWIHFITHCYESSTKLGNSTVFAPYSEKRYDCFKFEHQQRNRIANSDNVCLLDRLMFQVNRIYH